MLSNNNHLALAFIIVTFVIALCASTSNAENKTTHAPETYQIGERITYVEDGVTITVEPGSLTLYN